MLLVVAEMDGRNAFGLDESCSSARSDAFGDVDVFLCERSCVSMALLGRVLPFRFGSCCFGSFL